jgi:hypothetical protein
MADVSIVVADMARMAAIRDGLVLPGRVMHFASSSLASAVESIRAYRAKVVAVDALFLQTSSGTAFLARLDTMGLPANAIRLIVENDGKWIATSRQEPAGMVVVDRKSGAPPQQGAIASPKQPTVQSLSSVLAAPSFLAASNTRRAPRFLVRNPIEALVESGRANVIDMSVLGAQIVSLPVLRPNQRIKLGLLDSDNVVSLTGQVAWSLFEQTPMREVHYRVGIEFTDAAKYTLEDYRRRYCAEQPIPPRGH